MAEQYEPEDFDLYDFIACNLYVADCIKEDRPNVHWYLSSNEVRIKYITIARKLWREWHDQQISGFETYKKFRDSMPVIDITKSQNF